MENKKEMKSFASGAIREDKTGKGRHDLLPFCALNRLAKHFQKSLENHPAYNWQRGIPMSSFMDSAIRHLFMYMDGAMDEDHLCSAAWNILCAMWTEEKLPKMQDIPSRQKQKEHNVIYVCNEPICENFGQDLTKDCLNCNVFKESGLPKCVIKEDMNNNG